MNLLPFENLKIESPLTRLEIENAIETYIHIYTFQMEIIKNPKIDYIYNYITRYIVHV